MVSLVPRLSYAQILSRSPVEKSVFLHGCEIKSVRRKPGYEARYRTIATYISFFFTPTIILVTNTLTS